MKVKTLKKKLGQNTAEYIVMLVLIAVGSIGIFTIFGKSVRHQLSNAVAAFTGQSTEYHQINNSYSTEAKERAKNEAGMKGANDGDVTFDGGNIP